MGVPYPIPYRKRRPSPGPANSNPQPTPTPSPTITPTPITNPTPTPTPTPQHTTTTTTRTAPAQNQPQSESLYLAYSTTLSLPHLSTLCPSARLIGRAILRGYKWHISSTGKPNVIATLDKRSRVEGLVYLLRADEQAILERHEGVGTGIATGTGMRRVSVPAEIISAHPRLAGRTVRDILRAKERLVGEASHPRGLRGARMVRVSMFVRIFEVGEGVVRLDKEERRVLEDGLRDALRLGVTQRWMNEVVYPRLGPAQGQGQGNDFPHGQVEDQGQNQGQSQATNSGGS